jgi:hypothetical protein
MIIYTIGKIGIIKASSLKAPATIGKYLIGGLPDKYKPLLTYNGYCIDGERTRNYEVYITANNGSMAITDIGWVNWYKPNIEYSFTLWYIIG